MTERLFDFDGYIWKFEATVLNVTQRDDHYEILLDKTAFSPEGGGQYSDVGKIDGVKITRVFADEGNIYHVAEKSIEIGKKVVGEIDGDLRLRHMQNHTGEHIVSGIIHSRYGFNNVGFHLGGGYATMDVDGEINADALREIEKLANKTAAENRSVKAYYPTPDELEIMQYRSKLDIKENVRVVVIEGVDACACCAPHVSMTGEIGMIKLLSCQKYKGGTRILMKCGLDALDEFNAEYECGIAISNMISQPLANIDAGVKKLMDDIAGYKHDIYLLKKKILSLIADSVKPQNGKIVFVDESLDIGELRAFVAAKLEECEKFCVAFSGNDDDGYMYVFGYCGEDFKEFVNTKISALGSFNGGGKAPFSQGKVMCKKCDIEKLLLD